MYLKIKKLLFIPVGIALFVLGACSQDDAFNIGDSANRSFASNVETLQSGAVVEKRNGAYFYEGDICLTNEQLGNLSITGSIFGYQEEPTNTKDLIPTKNIPKENGLTRSVGVYPTGYNLWAMVRFTYDSSLTALHRARIKVALLRIQSNTNVRFYNATGQPTHDNTYNIDYPYVNFVYIGNQDTSNSKVGRVGGRQDINLADFAFYSWNTHVIEHEICHALGLFHEQCRSDRDNYVTINTTNLTELGQANFKKRTTNYSCRGSYDFQSVMGYDSYTSSTSVVYNTLQPMYTKIDGSEIHQGTQLSDGDRAWLNYYYIPYIARSDTYAELDSIVYDGNNNRLTETQRLQLQALLNNGNSTPPANGRISNEF